MQWSFTDLENSFFSCVNCQSTFFDAYTNVTTYRDLQQVSTGHSNLITLKEKGVATFTSTRMVGLEKLDLYCQLLNDIFNSHETFMMHIIIIMIIMMD